MQLLSKYNKKIRYLLCAINLVSKYVWVVPLKDKKGVNTFQIVLGSVKGKLNKTWID